jgi:Cdc6-like AAA superfamily ATPase
MAVELVKQAIRAFLRTPTPQVLCIRGKWGVGKTFIWNEVFMQAEADGAVALPYYCYVSLFSLHSIDEVRQSIFENRIPTSEVRIEPTFESMKRNVKHLTDLAAQQVSRFSSYAKVPY